MPPAPRKNRFAFFMIIQQNNGQTKIAVLIIYQSAMNDISEMKSQSINNV